MKQLSEQAKSLKPGIYRHYKGNEYRVFGVAWHSETLEEVVVYQAVGGDDEHYWVRPIDMFLSNIEVNGNSIPRFEAVEDKK